MEARSRVSAYGLPLEPVEGYKWAKTSFDVWWIPDPGTIIRC